MEYDDEIEEAFSHAFKDELNVETGSINHAYDGDGVDNDSTKGSISSAQFFKTVTENPERIEEIEMQPIRPVNSSTTVRSRNVQYGILSVDDSTANEMEQLWEGLPSRTVGRKKGARIGRQKSASVGYASLYRHNRLASIEFDMNDGTALIDELVEEGVSEESDFRDLPATMTLKRIVRSKAKEKEKDALSKEYSTFAFWKFRLSVSWKKFKRTLARFFADNAKLWHQDLKEIEGSFGSGVLSYFTFLRGIFLLSLTSFLLSFLFITVPQIFERPEYPGCNFTGEAILTGGNCLTDTLMYQGYYTNATITGTDGNVHYNMPMAYLLTMFGFFIFCLIWLTMLTGSSFKAKYVDSREDNSHFANKVFGAWDFGITSQRAATILQKTISTDLKEVLTEQRRGNIHRTCCQKFELFMLRTLTWGVYFASVAGAITLIYYVNNKFICLIISETNSLIFHDLALPLIVCTINLIMPFFVQWLTNQERYKYTRYFLYVGIFRNFLFKMGMLGVIGAFWTSNNVKGCIDRSNDTSVCWETNLGQEIYRLIVLDFIFTLVFSTFCAEYITKLIAKCRGQKQPEFLIANNVMDLIYGQTLCWIGIYFSPLLPIINVLKFFILFYIKKASVMNNCRPSTRRWRAAQSQTLFNFFQLASFLLSAAFLAYVIFNEMPSANCGPFRSQTRAYDVIVSWLDVLAATSSGEWFATILRIVTSVWVLDAIAILLLILVIFRKSETRGLESIAKSLKTQIALEGRDKMRYFEDYQKKYKHLQTLLSDPSSSQNT